MKFLLLTSCVLGLCKLSFAQITNSFPANGNVGIGTANPVTITEIKKTFTSGTTQDDFLRLTASQPRAWFSQVGLQFRWEDTGNSTAFNLAQITATPRWPSGIQSGGDLLFWTKPLNISANSELTEKMRVTELGYVGIGTSNPNSLLHLAGTQSNSILNVRATSNANGDLMGINFGGITYDKARIVAVNKNSGNAAGDLSFFTGGWPASTDVTEAMRITETGNIGIATSTPTEKLSVNGKIRAKEVKVEMANWPDYVFEKGYELTGLESIEKFIKENKHLPGIPSAAEVKRNGIELGEMNAKLLKKIEELTLYLINQNKIQQSPAP